MRYRSVRLILLSFLAFSSVALSAGEPASSAEETSALPVGASLPTLELTSPDGQPFDLNGAVAAKPTILILYRGGWCPYCNKQLGQLQAINTELIDLGYQIIAVSPDRPEKIRSVLDKTQYDYQLISDTRLAAALACGVAFKVEAKMVEKLRGYGIDLEEASGETHHLLPVPTVFVLDTEGTVRYVYSNADYKVRIDPAELVNEARKALG